MCDGKDIKITINIRIKHKIYKIFITPKPNNTFYLLNSYTMPGTLLIALHKLSHLTFTKAPQGGCFSHFIGKFQMFSNS